MDTSKISEAARTFAVKQLASIEALASIADEAGVGMSWGFMCETFEGAMDGFIDALGERVHSDAVRDLFAAEARLAFYGGITDLGNIRMWSMERLEALSEIEAEEQVAA